MQDPVADALARLTKAELAFGLATLASPRDLIQGYLQVALDVVPGAVGATLVTGSGTVAAVGAVAGPGPVAAFDLPPLRDVKHRLQIHRAEPDEGDSDLDSDLDPDLDPDLESDFAADLGPEFAEILLPALAARLRAALAFEDKVANLHHALSSRQVIGQATGVLMERHRINESQAFDRLVHASQQGHLKLREIAQRVVETGLEPNEAATAG